jgi:hypothetical protein
MKVLLIILLFLLGSQIFAQREAYSWIYGFCDSTQNDCSGWNGTAVIRFNDDSIASIDRVNFPSSFSRFTTSISDSNGRFLMAFNKKYLMDSSGTILSEFDTTDINSLFGGRQSSLFFKLKGNEEYFYLLNELMEFINPPTNQPLMNSRSTALTITKIQVNSLGFNIISTDTILRNDTLLVGSIHACRHANGRDWWIFKSTYSQKEYLKGLLTPHGLYFEIYEGPGPNYFQNSGRNQFSSDGTKFFHYLTTSYRKMHIYDFDRCSGELSNFREIDFSQFITYPPYDFTPFVLSPDASKIYIGRTNPEQTNYQTIQVDVESGQMTVVADSVFVPMLTPNNKWIVSGYQDVFFTNIEDLSVIKSPNNYAPSVNRTILDNALFVDGSIIEQPEWANHLLGPIDGTICDSLGLNNETAIIETKQFSFNIYPNPGQNELNFKTDLPLPIYAIIRDNQGKVVFENNYITQTFSITNGLSKLKSGLYFVELQSIKNQKRLARKWMKVGE